MLRSLAAELDAAAAKVARLGRNAAANADLNPDDHGEQAAAAVKYGGRFSAGSSSNPKARAMKDFHETVWKMTAALILIKPGIDEKLVFTVTRAPLKLFNAATMKVVVECWNWLLSARPDLEMKFLQEMIAAWHSSATARLGIFCVEDDRHSPLAPDEEMKENLRPRNPESEPHDIWIRFIQGSYSIDQQDRDHLSKFFSYGLSMTNYDIWLLCPNDIQIANAGEDRGGQVLQPRADHHVHPHAAEDARHRGG